MTGCDKMVVQEIFTKNNKNYIRHKSDSGFLIQRDGTDLKFADVVDIEEWGYTYSETDIPIPEPIETIPDTEALNIITGGEEA